MDEKTYGADALALLMGVERFRLIGAEIGEDGVPTRGGRPLRDEPIVEHDPDFWLTWLERRQTGLYVRDRPPPDGRHRLSCLRCWATTP